MNYLVAVRALCEFTAMQGDLDVRFSPSPTGLQGIAGHALVRGRRAAGYQSELSLSGSYGPLRVRGRADGYDADQNLLEEIKTYRGALAGMPERHRHLHWAQVRVYGHLLCGSRGLDHVHLALVYFDIGKQTETVLRETRSAHELAALFEQQCQRFLGWAQQEMAHRTARDAALTQLCFPHPSFRPGQRDLAETVFKANSHARCVLAQAPTGIGKTVGTLFPALKAAPRHGLDKVFYLAAKSSGRQLALEAAAALGAGRPDLPLRVLELVARDKACEHPDKACHGDSCPLAKGFYDRLPAARAAASTAGPLNRARLRELALEHKVCPYYLGSEMARWSDLIVGDYNYYFDASALLAHLTAANQWSVSVLVDEAHNLLARARSMYTAELARATLRAASACAPASLKTALARVRRHWPVPARSPYVVQDGPPDKLLSALQQALAGITELLAEQNTPLAPALQRFYFDARHLVRLGESFDTHSLFDISGPDAAHSTLCIRNIIPAPFLKPRFALAHSSTLFSATLSPWHYYSDALGLPPDTAWVDVASPFSATQLSVRIAPHISTRFKQRAASVAPISALIGQQYHELPGNYLAFFSSFDYLEQVADAFAAQCPQVALWRQPRHMSEAERDVFLARFAPGGCGIGFAVLGGAFGEGIDLPGTRLIGAFIATLGLPQVNPVNEQIRMRMQLRFGAGYDYAYLYPGLQKVVQAAGRVIRTEADRGVLVLIDERYARPDIQQLLPRWWNIHPASVQATNGDAITDGSSKGTSAGS